MNVFLLRAIEACFGLLLLVFPVTILSTKLGSGLAQFLVVLAGGFAFFVLLTLLANARAAERFDWHSHDPSPLRIFVYGWVIALVLEAFLLAFHQFRLSQVHSLVLRALALLALLGFIRGKGREAWFWWSVAAGCFAVFAIAMYQKFGLRLDRATGFHNAIHFGNFALLLATFAFVARLILPALTKVQGNVLILASVGGLCASLLSGSRGGWVAIPFFLVLAFHYSGVRRRVAVVISLILALLAFLALSIPETGLQSRFAAISADLAAYSQGTSTTSLGGRLELFRASWLVFLANPWVGVGENFGAVLKMASSLGFPLQAEDRLNDSHNEFLFAMVRGGIPGLLQLLLLYGAPASYFFFRLKRGVKGTEQFAFALAGLCLVVGVAIFGVSVNVFTRNVGKAFYFIMVVLLVALCERTAQDAPNR